MTEVSHAETLSRNNTVSARDSYDTRLVFHTLAELFTILVGARVQLPRDARVFWRCHRPLHAVLDRYPMQLPNAS